MAQTAHKGAISVALLHIPVALYTATQDTDLQFNQLCPDGSRVKYKKVCASCGTEISADQIQKGFQVEPGRYVVITAEDLEAIKTPRDKNIQILHTCDNGTIPQVYFDRVYHSAPEAGGDRAYELLRVALLDAGKVAVAKSVMGNNETLMALIPTQEEIMVQTLYFEAEIKAMPRELRHPELTPEEVKLAGQIVKNLGRPFDAAEHKNEYQVRLRELVENKVAGREVVAAPAEEPENNIVSLMDSLVGSAELTGGAKPKKRAARKKPSGDGSSINTAV